MPDSRRPYLIALQLAGELGFMIAIPLVAFALVGRWIDRHYHSGPWGLLGGVLLAMISTSVLLVGKFRSMMKDIDSASLPTPKV